jgi:hypothetical protein
MKYLNRPIFIVLVTYIGTVLSLFGGGGGGGGKRSGIESRRSPDLFNLVGKIRYSPLEGGVWIIQVGKKTYEPINLPDELKVNNASVVFTADFQTKLGGTHMVGPIIKLHKIDPAS